MPILRHGAVAATAALLTYVPVAIAFQYVAGSPVAPLILAPALTSGALWLAASLVQPRSKLSLWLVFGAVLPFLTFALASWWLPHTGGVGHADRGALAPLSAALGQALQIAHILIPCGLLMGGLAHLMARAIK